MSHISLTIPRRQPASDLLRSRDVAFVKHARRSNTHIMTANDSVLNGHRVEPAAANDRPVNGFHEKAPVVKDAQVQPPAAAPVTQQREPIAIIGCGIRLPGGIHNADAFWDLLTDRRDGRCIVPADRYNVSAYHTGQQPAKPGCVATDHG